MRALCEHLDVEPLRVAPSEGAPYAGLERVIDGSIHSTAPQSTIYSLMARARQAGAELVMSGCGSELLFGAEPPIFGDFLLKKPARALWCASQFQERLFSRPQLWRRLVAGPLARHLLPPAVVRARGLQTERHAGLRNLQRMSWAGPRLRAFLACNANTRLSRPSKAKASTSCVRRRPKCSWQSASHFHAGR